MIPIERHFARVLIKDQKGSYVVVSRDYGGRVLWNFPGGKVESGECPEAAAKRETYEEIGVRLNSLKKIWEDRYEIQGQFWVGHFFVAATGECSPFNCEVGIIKSVNFKSARELFKMPSIKEALAYVAAIEDAPSELTKWWPGILRQRQLPLWHGQV